MKKRLLTLLALLAMAGMAMAQDISAVRQSDGSWGFTMPARNLSMTNEPYSSNDPNGYTISGVPDGWLVIAAGDTVTITAGVTTPITAGAPISLIPPANQRSHIMSITLVEAFIPVTSITLNKVLDTIIVGQTDTLRVAEMLPDNATDPTVTWSSSDVTKATVDSNGVVTAVAAGTVTITASAHDGRGVTATCAVTVTPAGPTYPIALSAVTADYIGGVVTTDGNVYANRTDAVAAGKIAVAMICYVGTTGHATYSHGLALELTDMSMMEWSDAMSACSNKNTSTPVTNALWMLPSMDQWMSMVNVAGSYVALRNSFSGVGGNNLVGSDYWTSTEDTNNANIALYISFRNNGGTSSIDKTGSYYRFRACLAF